jgi:hypothetical protein
MVMIKKLYDSPSMEIYKLKTQQQLLFGSLIDTVTSDGLFEDDVEQTNFDEDPLVNMWEDAR